MHRVNAALEELEKAAREDKKGLWADPQPARPWEWREIKNRGVNRTDRPSALTQASNGGDRHTENVPCIPLRPSILPSRAWS
jgi:ribosomal protein L15E